MPQIKRLEIKNCLGIKELEVQAGKVNIITGGNEKGKTSILEVIEKGLRNTERRTRFVRNGADEATLYIEMDDTTSISRTEAADGKVKSKITQHGASVPKPETYLKSLIGEGFGFNPVDFMAKKDKEQTEILLSLMPMRVTEKDLMEWFGEIPAVNLNQHAIDVLAYLAEKYYYDRRAIANAAVKECANEIKALFEQLPDNYNGDAWRSVNLGDMWNKVQEANRINSLRQQAQTVVDASDEHAANINLRFDRTIQEQQELLEFKVDKARKSVDADKEKIADTIKWHEANIAEYVAEIERIQGLIVDLKNKISLCENDLKNIDESVVTVKIESLNNEHAIEIKNIEAQRQTALDESDNKVKAAQALLVAKPEIDIAPLEAEAKHAEQMKGYVNLYDNMRGHQEALAAKQATASHLDDCVALARSKPAELLQKIKMPIKGLGVNEQMQITIDGLPVSNLSTSRQMRLALDIARATAGPLNLIAIDRFESLDKDQQEMFFKEVEADGYQYFVSLVTNGELKVETKEGGGIDGYGRNSAV